MKEQASLLDSFRLDGRVAAITGGARGIGFATARLFTAAGARTVLLDIDGAAAAGAAASLGPLAGAMPLDVSVETDVNRVFAAIAAALGGECARTFRPFVTPALRRQTREEQDLAATACVAIARSVCATARLQRTPKMVRKCEEFR